MKECPKCHRKLPESSFYVRDRDKGWLQSWCMDCCKDHGRLRNGSTGIYRQEIPKIKLNMDKEVAKVYETYDYDKFHIMEKGNRVINHVSAIKKSMQKEFLFSPIIVNKDMEIVDGQNRFFASKELGKPIYYIIRPEYGINEVRLLNSGAKNWGKRDFIKSYAEEGNEEYQMIFDFMKKFPDFSAHIVEYILRLSSANTVLGSMDSSKKNANTAMSDGTFKVKDWRKSIKIAEWLMQYKPFHKNIYKRIPFVVAIIKLSRDPQFDNDEVIRKIQQNPRAFVPCVNSEEFIRMIEEIVNFRSRNKIRFNV